MLNKPSVMGSQSFLLGVGLGTDSLLLKENQHVMNVIEGLDRFLGTSKAKQKGKGKPFKLVSGKSKWILKEIGGVFELDLAD
jgi:hypothetical protein